MELYFKIKHFTGVNPFFFNTVLSIFFVNEAFIVYDSKGLAWKSLQRKMELIYRFQGLVYFI